MSKVGKALRETGASLGVVIRNPGLRRVNLAFAGSDIGDWAYATAIVVWAYGVGGAVAVGVWGSARFVLLALLTPFASTLADRFPRKAVLVSTDTTRAVLTAISAVLIWGEAPAAAVFVVATLSSLVSAPFRPAVAALVTELVDEPDELTAANGAASTIESLAFFVGPALGGLLITVSSVPVVVALNAATFVWSAAIISRIRVPERPHAAAQAVEGPPASGPEAESAAEEAGGGWWRESMEGFSVIAGDPHLRLITFLTCAQTVVAGASLVFGIEIAVQMTDFGPRGVGYLDSVLGVGAIIGGLVAVGRTTARRMASDFGIGVILWALPLALIAIWPQMWAAFLAMALLGFANPIVDVNSSTILQRLTDDRVMGRVFGALEAGLIAGMALGSLIMPVMVGVLGLRWSLTVLALGITVLTLPAFGRLRRLDRELAEPAGLSVLRDMTLFAPLDAKSLEQLARQLGRRDVPAGEAIIREGDVGDRFYIVESGHATVRRGGEVVAHLGPEDPFGEIALLRDVPRTADVIAEDDAVLLWMEREPFLAAVAGDAGLATRIDDLVSRRTSTY